MGRKGGTGGGGQRGDEPGSSGRSDAAGSGGGMPGGADERIANAIARLRSSVHPKELPRLVDHAVETLVFLREELAERDRVLDELTSPDRDAAAEAARLRTELAAARSRLERVEIDLKVAREELAIAERANADDRARRAELERRVADMDRLLLRDDDAFKRFMDQSLDEGERGKGRRGQGGR